MNHFEELVAQMAKSHSAPTDGVVGTMPKAKPVVRIPYGAIVARYKVVSNLTGDTRAFDTMKGVRFGHRSGLTIR